MDPITIVGLASSILTFVQFGTKVIQCAHHAKLKEDTEAIDVTVSELQRLCMALDPDSVPENENEKALYRLAEGCKTVSEEIIDLLGKIKPRECSSKIQNMDSAIKLKLYECQLSEREVRLNAYQKQLELQLNYMSRSEINNKLDSLVYIDGENGTQLNTLQSHVLQLCQGVQVSSLGEKAQEHLRKLLGLSENAAKRMAQQRILKALAFSTMRRRFDAVEEAHEQTFRWMFEEKLSSGTGDDSHSHDSQEYKQGVAGRLFTDWLSRGQGIFHITGKIGSGKSTLVKFLYNHPRTRQELDTWAGARKLVIANFFFWKPGNELQTSLEGLLQSVLHDLLKQCPEFIAVVFPKHWDQVYNGSSNNRSELEFRPDEIREAFRQSIRNGTLYHKYCFCFFIDGLDEYQETHQDDFKTMVELLRKWTKIAPESVKFCVSSREYNVFLNGFSPDRRIKVQDLTKSDIEMYTEDKLKDVDLWTKRRLVSCIVDRQSSHSF